IHSMMSISWLLMNPRMPMVSFRSLARGGWSSLQALAPGFLLEVAELGVAEAEHVGHGPERAPLLVGVHAVAVDQGDRRLDEDAPHVRLLEHLHRLVQAELALLQVRERQLRAGLRQKLLDQLDLPVVEVVVDAGEVIQTA